MSAIFIFISCFGIFEVSQKKSFRFNCFLFGIFNLGIASLKSNTSNNLTIVLFSDQYKNTKMGIGSFLYHSVAKRTSTFVLAMGVSAFVFERGKNSKYTASWPQLYNHYHNIPSIFNSYLINYYRVRHVRWLYLGNTK